MRMFQDVINRITTVALVGATALAVVGALEGAITGTIFHVCLYTSPHLGGLRGLLGRGFNGAREAAQLGGFTGFLLGFTSFASIAFFHPTRDPRFLIKHLLKFGTLGTMVSVILGAVGGTSTSVAMAWLLQSQDLFVSTSLWSVSPPPAPLNMMLAEAALVGYVWGVVIGFVAGLCVGLSLGVRRTRQEGFAPQERGNKR